MFMKAVAAYRMGDIHVLRQIALAITEEKIEDLPEDDLPALIQKAQASVDSFKKRIDKMNAEFPFIYRDKLKNEDWVKEQKVEISERISAAKKQLEEKQNYLMMLKLWKPDSLS